QLAEMALDEPSALPDCAQQAQRETPANDRGDLQDPLGIIRKPVDAGHDDIVNRVGNRASGALLVSLAGVEGKLLEKKRVRLGFGAGAGRERRVKACGGRGEQIRAVAT